MFHGLTMVNFDGQTQNQMMVRPWSTMVDHGQPWSDGQAVAGVNSSSGKVTWARLTSQLASLKHLDTDTGF